MTSMFVNRYLRYTTVTHRTAAKMARVVDLFKNLLAKNIREPKGITGRVVLVSYKYFLALHALCEKSCKLIIVKLSLFSIYRAGAKVIVHGPDQLGYR